MVDVCGKREELHTPAGGSTVTSLSSPEALEAIELKRRLAFEEELRTPSRKEDNPALEVEKETPSEKPRSSRTSATKISPALLQKIENQNSGIELKITSIIAFDSLSVLCQALSNNHSTERLDLEGCGIGDKGCVLIRDLLIKNQNIKHVDLQMNQISDVGCRYLSEILPKNYTLRKLYLGYNDIKDDGVYALISAMRPRGELEIVVSGNANVSDLALGRLDRALEQQWKPSAVSSKLKKEVLTADANPYMGLFASSSPKTKEKRSKSKSADDDDEPLAKRARGAEAGSQSSLDPEQERELSRTEQERDEIMDRSRAKAVAERAEKAKEKERAQAERAKEAVARRAERVAVKKSPSSSTPKSQQSSTPISKEESLVDEDVDSAPEDEVCDDDEEYYTGAPFKYTFVDNAYSTIWSDGSSTPDSRIHTHDLHAKQRKTMAGKFNLQWRRLRGFIEDALQQDSKQLTGIRQLPAPQNLFGKACKFIARQQGFGHRQLLDPAPRVELPTPTEKQRRRLVRQRVRGLTLKFKHMVEDTAREQRCEAQMLAILHGTLLPSQGEVPAGYSAELGFVHVPCPFKLQIQLCDARGEAAPVSVV